jgi:hypothetical protein
MRIPQLPPGSHLVIPARPLSSGAPRLLIDATAIEELPVPTLVDRFVIVEDWAQAAQSVVAVAIVTQARYIHPRQFVPTAGDQCVDTPK